MAEDDVILKVNNLQKYFPVRKGLLRKVQGYIKAVDDVSFKLRQQNTLGLVGESGCGKTTLIKSIIRAFDPTGGEVLFKHKGDFVDLSDMGLEDLKKVRRNLQLIFQDPYSSLNPRMSVRDIIGEPLIVNNISKGKKMEKRVMELMDQVGLNPQYLKRYPHAFSGGQRQRIGLARALSLNPHLILADEPTSALDVSVQAQILNLMGHLQDEFDLSYIFISHDLTVVQYISDRVGVMYVGKLVETAETEELFLNPSHPYTEALLSAVPYPDPHYDQEKIVLSGDVPDPANLPSGCAFHPRCNYSQDICEKERPELTPLEGNENHHAACHFADELSLQGMELEDEVS